MEETLKRILSELQNVNTRLDGIENGQLEIKRDISSLEQGQQEIKRDVSSLEQGQQEIKRDVSIIKDNLINGLGPYFERIEQHIDERTDELKDTLEDQQRVIDILSVRSIKHESEIKDFKRMLKNQ
ncbi:MULTISPECIES: hypothetical protein [Sutcliffiella]|uniref:Uncharacterized protein n=1 Tax=Sutcliffiella cohnii TaxID=33932 RepID=A0A223KNW3_9BACI|nr:MULTISPECIES: hypothetical protein [Sutcliffiella]AST91023.1 hypothetical protein BC6307_06890 [Sutcliffiella cohnii]WBL16821.1 hypothetical protein O1A01_09370 [Sutcliffiella sp. NC1]